MRSKKSVAASGNLLRSESANLTPNAGRMATSFRHGEATIIRGWGYQVAARKIKEALVVDAALESVFVLIVAVEFW